MKNNVPYKLRIDNGTIRGTAFKYAIRTSTCIGGSWVKKSSFPVRAADGNGFSINGTGYILTGGPYPPGGSPAYLYAWDTTLQTWTRKADYPGNSGTLGVAFGIGNKAYAGLGGGNGSSYRDFWEYDPSTNTWTKMPDLPIGNRLNASSFVIGNKGYVCGGSGLGATSATWEWDQTSKTWTKKADLPIIVDNAVGFAIGSKGYICGGYSNGFSVLTYEYDPLINTWNRVANLGGPGKVYPFSFVINNIAYIGTGWIANGVFTNDVWRYNAAKNAWSPATSFCSGDRAHTQFFSLGNKGYVQGGSSGGFVGYAGIQDFWQFDPSTSDN
ncbi:MAG: hypothetical protein K2Q22_09760, partial [Cytophagales bacterium]|nr:hypothetical protein [Cytophagales bacterium]